MGICQLTFVELGRSWVWWLVGYFSYVEIGAAEYRAAAEDHLRAAGVCHRDGNYVTCHYLCGLCVECILRAYRWKVNGDWDGRHVLPKLYREAKFDELITSKQIEEMADRFGTITSRWANNHRYTSQTKLQRHLNDIGATINVKGDKLKQNSQEMYDAAEFIFGIGKTKWKN